jgi:predicted dehydrogenase
MALGWGLIGGGIGSQIGPAHRIAAALDHRFELVACALDADPDKGRADGVSLGVGADRSYGDWREMLKREAGRDDRPDLVTVATPNSTHFTIASALLDAGFHVMCEKPLTTTLDEARQLVRLAHAKGRLCAVNYGYSGYPMVRQMREMVRAGELGDLRLIVAEFAHGFHGSADDADNPRTRWRYDPAQAGISAVFADCGIHALNLACFVSGERVSRLSADFASCVDGRVLEDDAMINFRTEGDIVGRLWTSAVAIGRMHGLGLQVFGSKGGLSWRQEQPNQLRWTKTGGATTILERGGPQCLPCVFETSRLAIGHPEGMIEAFANIYGGLADTIEAGDGAVPEDLPMVEDGAHSIAAIEAAVRSSRDGGAWQTLDAIG